MTTGAATLAGMDPQPAGTSGARGGPAGLTTAAATRVVAVVLVAALGVYLLYLLRQPISWLVLGAFIAVTVSGPVTRLEGRLPRGAAIAVVYVGVLLAPLLILAVLVPPLVEQADRLANNAPQYARDLSRTVSENATLRSLDQDYDVTSKLREQAAQLPGKVSGAAGSLANVGASIVSSVFAGVTILILSIFMVGGAPRWRRAFMRTQPPDRAQTLDRLFDRIRSAIGAYVGGALLQALIAGVASWIVLLILGVPHPAALALVVFLFDLVPLVGATLGAILVGVVTLFSDFPTATIIWTVWSLIYQQVENTVIQPRIQSRALQVEPFIVLVAVLFGSALFGVIGALLAIPAAASLQITLAEWLRYRRARRAELTGAPDPAPVLTAPGGS